MLGLGVPGIHWVVPPPSNSHTNEGFGWDPLLKMVHNPGGDWNPGRGGQPKVYIKHGPTKTVPSISR